MMRFSTIPVMYLLVPHNYLRGLLFLWIMRALFNDLLGVLPARTNKLLHPSVRTPAAPN